MSTAIANVIYGWPFDEDYQRLLSNTLTEDDYEEDGCLLWEPHFVNEGLFETLYTANGDHTPAYCGVSLRTLTAYGTSSIEEFQASPSELEDLQKRFAFYAEHLPEDAVKALKSRYGDPKLWVIWSTT